jgi:putative ABC transport system permease protein
VHVRVAATYGRPLGFGEIVLPRTVAAPHVTDALDDVVYVKTQPGADVHALERLAPAVAVATRSQYLGELKAEARQQSLIVYVLLGVVVAFSALAVVNALTMAIAERGRELALLRLVGATRRHVRRMVRVETLIVVVFGVTIGSLVAAPALAVFSYGLTGTAMPDVPLWMVGAIVASSALLALAATVLPTRVALRVNPVAAMGARE